MNLIAGLVLASSLVLIGCEEKASPPAPKPAAQPAPTKTGAVIPGVSPETSKGITDMAAGAKDKAVAAYQTAVDDAKKQIDTWSTKLNDAPADQKPAMQSALDKAKAGWEEATKKLADLKSSASTEWQKVSSDVQDSVDSLKKHLSDAAAQFK